MTRLSRSKIELFLECPRCFWLDLTRGVKRPQPPPYTINNAIDYLLKQEFDLHREKGVPHPLMQKHRIEAVPFRHDDLDKWRHNFTGIQYYHEPTDFLVTGAVDDVWTKPDGELIVVDYKATGANQHQVYDSYRRQMEIYQWLLRQNGFRVAPTGYFVFARVNKANGFSASGTRLPASPERERGEPDGQARLPDGQGGDVKPALSFDMFVEPHTGEDSWVEGTLTAARKVFNAEQGPPPNETCGYCTYRRRSSG